MTVADPGEGPSSPLILDQTEVPRAEKSFFETSPLTPPPPPPPRPLSQGLVERASPYLKVWICH